MPQQRGPIDILTRVRSAYPGGVVPGADYPALLGLLHQVLPVDDVVRVAAELVVRGASPYIGVDIRGAITAVLSSPELCADVERVGNLLHAHEWTLGDVI